MYLHLEYTVCILDKISICSNRAAWNRWVMLTFHHRTPAWSRWVMMTFHHPTPAWNRWVMMTFHHRTSADDDVKAENARRSIVTCQLQGGAVNKKDACFGVCHTSSDFKRFVSRLWITVFTELVRSSSLRLLCLCLVTFGAVVSNTSRDFERVISCSSLRVFQELVRELGLLYV